MLELPSLFLYGDDHIGTHARAAGAADAGVLIHTLGGVIALGVDAYGSHLQDVLGAEVHAQPAALALFFIKGHFRHFLPFLPSAFPADPTLESKTRG